MSVKNVVISINELNVRAVKFQNIQITYGVMNQIALKLVLIYVFKQEYGLLILA